MTKLLTPVDIRVPFEEGLDLAEKSAIVSSLALVVEGSNQEEEDYRWMTPAKAPTLWEGKRRTERLPAHRLVVRNRKWESSVDLPIPDVRRAVRSGKMDIVRHQMGVLAGRMVEHRWTLIETLLRNGTAGTALGYDGLPFFSAAHVDGASGTQTNLYTASEVPELGVTSPTAPTSEEAALALLGVMTSMATIRDSAGEPMNEALRSVRVVARPRIAGILASALEAVLDNGRSNPLLGLTKRGWSVDVWPDARMEGDANWDASFAVIRDDSPFFKAFVFQDEYGVRLSMKDEDSDYAFDTDCIAVGADVSSGAGYLRWEMAAKATFS